VFQCIHWQGDTRSNFSDISHKFWKMRFASLFKKKNKIKAMDHISTPTLPFNFYNIRLMCAIKSFVYNFSNKHLFLSPSITSRLHTLIILSFWQIILKVFGHRNKQRRKIYCNTVLTKYRSMASNQFASFQTPNCKHKPRYIFLQQNCKVEGRQQLITSKHFFFK